MKKLNNFSNSIHKKVVLSIIILLALIAVVCAILVKTGTIHLPNPNVEIVNPIENEKGNEILDSGDKKSGDEIIDESGEQDEVDNKPTKDYEKLQKEDYTIKDNKITFKEDIDVDSFCISSSENGPTEDDVWHNTEDKKEIELDEEELNGEIVKKFVYYKANAKYLIGSTSYSTLKAAIDAAASGKTITVSSGGTDSGTANMEIPSGKSLTIDTNGKTVSGLYRITVRGALKIIGTGTLKSRAQKYFLQCYGNLWIGDSSGGPTIDNPTTDESISNPIYTVYVGSGKLTLTNGTLKWSGTYVSGKTYGNTVALYNGGSFFIGGGTVLSNFVGVRADDASTGVFDIDGGKIESTSYAFTAPSGSSIQVQLWGGTLTSSSGTATVNHLSTGNIYIGDSLDTFSTSKPTIKNTSTGYGVKVATGTEVEFSNGSISANTGKTYTGPTPTVHRSGYSITKTVSNSVETMKLTNQYTVSFNANGGSGGQSANVTATYGSAMPTISTTKPSKPGYTFAGWYDAASGGTQYYNASCASARSYNKTSNCTLYAQWTINSYYLDLNGWLDGASSGGIANYGTANVYINGTKVSSGVADFCQQVTYGSKYKIEVASTASGKKYRGVHSGSLEGTIGAGNVSVFLDFVTLYTVKCEDYFVDASNNRQVKIQDARYKDI